jgi:hypothetical protein
MTTAQTISSLTTSALQLGAHAIISQLLCKEQSNQWHPIADEPQQQASQHSQLKAMAIMALITSIPILQIRPATTPSLQT